MIKQTIPIKGMHCRSCEILIEDELKKIAGVRKVDISYKKKQAVLYCKTSINEHKLEKAIENAGYTIGKEKQLPWITKNQKDVETFLLVLLIISFIYLTFSILGLSEIISINNFNSTSLPIVFLIGLTAGVSTCMALVGGLVLSVAAKFSKDHPHSSKVFKLRPHLLFNLGRVVGFFVLGGLIGTIGSVLQVSPLFTGIMTIAIGVVMLFLGLQLTGLFPKLSTINISMPSSISKILGINTSEDGVYSDTSSAFLGAATFFLPCGFTQSMQLLAIASGNFITGGTIMAVFALGTAPGLLGVGGIASIVKGEFAKKFFVFSGVVVVLFSIFNIKNGLNLTGAKTVFATFTSGNARDVKIDTQTTEVVKALYTKDGLTPRSIPIKAGVPTKLVIEVQADGVGCMTSMTIPGLDNSMYRVSKGSELTFTVTAPIGTHNITCSMGMLHGTLIAN